MDLDVATRFVELKSGHRMFWAAAKGYGSCGEFFPTMQITIFHKIAVELPWGGDGDHRGDPMVIVEMFDATGKSAYTWFPKKRWAEMYQAAPGGI